MTMNKKARTEQAETTTSRRPEEEEEQEDESDSYYDDEDNDDSFDSEASDDEEELEALQLLSQQIQEAKRANQQLKQALVATIGQKKEDKSSSELVASLFAGRKATKNDDGEQK